MDDCVRRVMSIAITKRFRQFRQSNMRHSRSISTMNRSRVTLPYDADR
jgi:hypothetical protein